MSTTSNEQDKPWNAEEAMQRALKDVLEDNVSQRAASSLRGVARSTLGARLRGAQDRQSAHVPQQRLSRPEEGVIVDWAADM
ncbi:hypothetical protein FRC12_013503 [Ceratobasidium sp. 428]|nr:hypothetical protein FRC12_013503 [Ceratobasidium sp. 428]